MEDFLYINFRDFELGYPSISGKEHGTAFARKTYHESMTAKTLDSASKRAFSNAGVQYNLHSCANFESYVGVQGLSIVVVAFCRESCSSLDLSGRRLNVMMFRAQTLLQRKSGPPAAPSPLLPPDTEPDTSDCDL